MPTRSLGGTQDKLEFWGPPLHKIFWSILRLTITLLSRLFTGEPEVNYSGEDTRVLPWLSVRASVQ